MHPRLPYAAGSKVAPRNQTVTQQRGHSLERKKEQADTELSASAESAVQRASSDASSGRVQRTDRKVLWSSLSFLIWNRKATQRSGCLAERKKETADMELSPPRRKRNAAAFF